MSKPATLETIRKKESIGSRIPESFKNVVCGARNTDNPMMPLDSWAGPGEFHTKRKKAWAERRVKFSGFLRKLQLASQVWKECRQKEPGGGEARRKVRNRNLPWQERTGKELPVNGPQVCQYLGRCNKYYKRNQRYQLRTTGNRSLKADYIVKLYNI